VYQESTGPRQALEPRYAARSEGLSKVMNARRKEGISTEEHHEGIEVVAARQCGGVDRMR
jgi:hypothetical protein